MEAETVDRGRKTSPWVWILLAVVAVLGAVALAIAISASNETVDQQEIVNEATTQIRREVAGLNVAITAAKEFQDESDELAEQDRERINRQVDEAVKGGEAELRKVKNRLGALEGETAKLGDRVRALEGDATEANTTNKDLRGENRELAAELEELEARVTKLEK